jgi:hypothetical protein
MYRYTVLLYTTLLYLCLHNSYKRDTHTDIALYIYRFMYKYAEQLYTSFTDGLCLCGHNCTLLYNLTLSKHTLAVHTLCSDQLYCCTLILYTLGQSYCVNNCTVRAVHSLLQAWPLFCQPITEDLRFTCFTLIGPLGIPYPPL